VSVLSGQMKLSDEDTARVTKPRRQGTTAASLSRRSAGHLNSSTGELAMSIPHLPSPPWLWPRFATHPGSGGPSSTAFAEVSFGIPWGKQGPSLVASLLWTPLTRE